MFILKFKLNYMRKLLMLLMFVFFTIVNVKAQTNYLPGFIVTLEGDSVTGLVDSRGAIRNSQVCSYRTDMENKPIEYQPGEIKTYGFVEGKYYVSKDVPIEQDTTKLFLEYLINGIVDVYYCRDMSGDHYYVEKEGMRLTALDDEDKILEIKGEKFQKKYNRYVGVLKYTFNESPDIQKKVEGMSLTHKNLINISKDYHAYVCEGEECIVYEKKKLKVKFSLEPIVSIDFHNLKGNRDQVGSYDVIYDTYTPEEIEYLPEEFTLKSTDFDYSIGLIGSLSFPSLNENLALNLQVKYGRYKLSGEEDLSDGNLVSLSTEGKNLMNNLYFSYTFPKGMFRPVFLAGFSYSYFTSINNINIIEHSFEYSVGLGEYVSLDENDADVIEASYMGFVVGVGLDIPVFKKYKISTTVQYNFMKDTGYSYSYNPLSIVIGFKF